MSGNTNTTRSADGIALGNTTGGDRVLAVADLSVSYPGKRVLTGLSLELRAGEVYGLLGRNGAGKTTLINALMRLVEPTDGTITCWGEDVHAMKEGTWRRVSYLGEMAGVLSHWTVRRLAAFQEHSYGRLRRDWVDRLLGQYSIAPRSTLRSLSRGQQQMVGLILAIAVEPDLLLLDEPAAGLDPVARRDFLGQVLELMGDRNTATLVTSHILSDVERIVDRVGFLAHGRIILEGALDDLKERCALVRLRRDAAAPEGVEVLRRTMSGEALVAGDLSRMPPGDVQPLGLEDLYVELLGDAGRRE